MLPELVRELQSALGVQHKRDIQTAARLLPRVRGGPWGAAEVRVGDDTAAIPDGDGYLLFAAEGMWPELVASEPRFAGYCAVMVNASDVYAMGGRPLAIVDALFAAGAEAAEPILQGMADASERFQIPIVGGHTNLHSPYPALAAAVLGRARRLLTSFDARPGDELVVAVDLRGRMHPRHAFWNASTDAAPARLRADYALLPRLAEEGDGMVVAAKDISMGGHRRHRADAVRGVGCRRDAAARRDPAPRRRPVGDLVAGLSQLRLPAGHADRATARGCASCSRRARSLPPSSVASTAAAA